MVPKILTLTLTWFLLASRPLSTKVRDRSETVQASLNMAGPWTLAGNPVVFIPMGIDNSGLPLGIQVVGKFDSDELLVPIAMEVELLM